MLRGTVLFVTLCFSASHATASRHKCPQGWIVYNGECYGYGGSKVSYGDALAICNSYGAKLVEIETSSENSYLKRLIKDNGGNQVWIGGNDIFREGSWQWISTGDRLQPYSNWHYNQPNGNAGQDCLAIWEEGGVLNWHDVWCPERLNFICEKEPLDLHIHPDIDIYEYDTSSL